LKKYSQKRYTINNFLQEANLKNNSITLQDKICPNYNVDCSLGVVKKAKGLSELTLPVSQFLSGTKNLEYLDGINIKRVWRYKYYSDYNSRYDYMLVVLGSDNHLYCCNIFAASGTLQKITTTPFTSQPTALNFRVNGRDVMGFFSPTDDCLVWYCDEYPYTVSSMPKFSSLCLHNERLFAIDSEKNYLVRYSSNLNPLDWKSNVTTTSGGVIELNDYKGQLKSLVSFLDNIYVFRDFGISKISSYVASSAFTAVNIFNSSAKIYAQTACICGKNIYFLAEDGLYKLDGYNVEKVNTSLNNLFLKTKQEDVNFCFYEGKLYISCKLDYNDNTVVGCESEENTVNNTLIEYDIETNNYTIIRGVDVTCMLAVRDLFLSRLIFCLNNSYSNKLWQLSESSRIGTTILAKKWQSEKIHFNLLDKQKILKEINFICKQNCKIEVSTEIDKKSFSLQGSETLQRVPINVVGKVFDVTVFSNNEDIFVSSMQLLFNVED